MRFYTVYDTHSKFEIEIAFIIAIILKRRNALAKQAFLDLGYILRDNNLSFRIRFCLFKCYVCSVFLYDCESWSMAKETIKKVNGLELWFLRRMQRIS